MISQLLNSLTIFEMECSIGLAQITIPCSKSVHFRCAAINTSETFSHESLKYKLKGLPIHCPFIPFVAETTAFCIFSYCCSMTFVTSVYYFATFCNEFFDYQPILDFDNTE